jgi:hypothetical protein
MASNLWSPTSEGPGAVIYFYEEPPFLFLQNKLEYLSSSSTHKWNPKSGSRRSSSIYISIGSIQKNQTPVSVWFLLTYTGAAILTFFFQQHLFKISWFWFKFHTYQKSNCLRKQNQVLDSSLVLISKIKPNFHSVLTNRNQNPGFLSPEPINTYQCWVVLTRTLDSQTSITFGDKRPIFIFENQLSSMGEPESNSQGRK